MRIPKGPQVFSTTGPFTMQQIVANMSRGDVHTFNEYDDGTYGCYGGYVGKRSHFSIGDDVVVMNVGRGVAAMENLTQFEKVKVVGVEPRGENPILRRWSDTPILPSSLPGSWYPSIHHDLIVQKENGMVVPMVYPFEVSTIGDYMSYWRQVMGRNHSYPGNDPEDRCPTYC